MRPVSIGRVAKCTSFTTFHFTPTGKKWNCMSKITFIFVINFVSRKIETRDQCQSLEWQSVHLSQPSILPLVVKKGIVCPKLTFYLCYGQRPFVLCYFLFVSFLSVLTLILLGTVFLGSCWLSLLSIILNQL